jgi:hypothetical protein
LCFGVSMSPDSCARHEATAAHVNTRQLTNCERRIIGGQAKGRNGLSCTPCLSLGLRCRPTPNRTCPFLNSMVAPSALVGRKAAGCGWVSNGNTIGARTPLKMGRPLRCSARQCKATPERPQSTRQPFNNFSEQGNCSPSVYLLQLGRAHCQWCTTNWQHPKGPKTARSFPMPAGFG